MAGALVQIDVDDAALNRALTRVLMRLENPREVFVEIGEVLTESTKARFQTSSGPDGQAWARNSDVTILQYLSRYKGAYKKDGSMSKRGAARAGAKKPLIGETRMLSTTISYQASRDQVKVGTNAIQGATMHHGAKRGAFGRTKWGAPIPWGDIPPRPFVGLSTADREDIAEILARHLGADLG